MVKTTRIRHYAVRRERLSDISDAWELGLTMGKAFVWLVFLVPAGIGIAALIVSLS